MSVGSDSHKVHKSRCVIGIDYVDIIIMME